MPTPLRLRCTCGHVQEVGPDAADVIDCDACGAPLRVFAPPPGLSISLDNSPQLPPERPQWDEWEGEVVEIRADLAPSSIPIEAPAPIGPAAATNLAATRVEWPRYYRSYPAQLVVGLGAILVGMTAAIALPQPAYLLLAAAGAWYIAWDVSSVKRLFRLGEVRPAVVVSTHPPLIAVSADLRSTAASPRPAVKILRQPLKRLHGGIPPVGTQLAAVALPGDRWQFNPQILRCATADEVEVGRVTGTLGPQDWQELDELLNRCPARASGVYTLWDDNALGGRRPYLAWLLWTLAIPILVAAILLPLVFFGPRQKQIPVGSSVPGRVHMDWGR